MLRNLFDRKSEGQASTPGASPRYPRHSGGWAALRKRLGAEAGLRVIDAGATSPNNINYLTTLGHSVFLADPVQDAVDGAWQKGSDEDGKPIFDVDAYLTQTMEFSGRMFDVVLLWTTLDYLPEAFVAPVVDRLYSAMNPGGQVLAFFHTRDKGEETEYCRFHLTDTDDVEMQFGQNYPIQRAFTNRGIERLFSRWSGFRQFLAKDAVSEVLISR